MSLSPNASGGTPGRLETKYRVRPSSEMAGAASESEVLIPAPRLTGADHSDHFESGAASAGGISTMAIVAAAHAATSCRIILVSSQFGTSDANKETRRGRLQTRSDGIGSRCPDEMPICPRCEAELISGDPDGLCPSCLILGALGSSDS